MFSRLLQFDKHFPEHGVSNKSACIVVEHRLKAVATLISSHYTTLRPVSHLSSPCQHSSSQVLGLVPRLLRLIPLASEPRLDTNTGSLQVTSMLVEPRWRSISIFHRAPGCHNKNGPRKCKIPTTTMRTTGLLFLSIALGHIHCPPLTSQDVQTKARLCRGAGIPAGLCK